METENSGLVVRKDFSNKAVAVIAAAKSRLAQLSEIRSKKFATNCQFKFTPAATQIASNLKTETDLQRLMEISAFLRRKKTDIENEYKEYGIDSYPVISWLGYTIEDWLSDIKIRVTVLTVEPEMAELKRVVAEAEKYISETKRAENFFESAEKFLSM